MSNISIIDKMNARRTECCNTISELKAVKKNIDKRTISKMVQEIRDIDLSIKYVERGADVSIVRGQLYDVERKLALIKERYAIFDCVKKFDKQSQRLSYYNKLMGVPTLNAQRKYLKYLMSYFN